MHSVYSSKSVSKISQSNLDVLSHCLVLPYCETTLLPSSSPTAGPFIVCVCIACAPVCFHSCCCCLRSSTTFSFACNTTLPVRLFCRVCSYEASSPPPPLLCYSAWFILIVTKLLETCLTQGFLNYPLHSS